MTKTTLRNIAQIHGLFTQAMHYHRGSAGLADMLAKTLINHLDEFTQHYTGFFETPPV